MKSQAAIRARSVALFWSHVRMTLFCWEWTASVGGPGYGNGFWMGKARAAHRISWEIAFGPIPDGLHVLHRCDNRRCVNPAHLFLGTNSDNIVDAMEKGRKPHGESHRSSKITEAQARSVVERIRSGQSQAHIARELGVSRSTIQKIAAGETWAHLKLVEREA